MAPHAGEELQEARYAPFSVLPDDAVGPDGQPALNKYSAAITRGHDFPGAQVRIAIHSAFHLLVWFGKCHSSNSQTSFYTGHALRFWRAR